MTTDNLNFCDALRAIKSGKRAQRAGWNGKGLFAFLQPGSVHGPHLGPQFQLTVEPMEDNGETIDGISVSLFNTNGAEHTAMRYPQLCLSFPTGTFGAWAPSQTDMLASDWLIVEEVKAETVPTVEPARRRGIVSVNVKDEPLLIRSLREGGGVLIKREPYDLNSKVALIVEHDDIDLIPHGSIMPRYVMTYSDKSMALEFQKVSK